MSQINFLTPFQGNYAYAMLCISGADISSLFRVKDPSSSNPVFYIDASGFSQLIVFTDNIYNSNYNYGTLTYSAGKKLCSELGNAYVYDTSGVVDYTRDPSNVLYTVDNKTIKDDCIRNLAHYLFGTQYGAKILRNRATILSNIDTTITSIFNTNIYGILNYADGMSANHNDASNNIGLHMYNSIIATYPDRMNTLIPSDISNNIFKMPFYSGDKMYMRFSINYPAGQGSIVEKITDPPSRNYQVCLNLI
jgi:hypothetical protein